MSIENRSNPPQTVDEILTAIGGPTAVPHQPEGGSELLAPLNPLGLDRVGAEPFPATPNAQQGTGSGGYLTPGAKGTADDGTVHNGYKGDAYAASSGGPIQRPILSGVASLTAGQHNTPADGNPVGSTAPAAMPAGGPQLPLGDNQGAGLNPALKKALGPRPGPFGDPSL